MFEHRQEEWAAVMVHTFGGTWQAGSRHNLDLAASIGPSGKLRERRSTDSCLSEFCA
jgi:hypothetical protein